MKMATMNMMLSMVIKMMIILIDKRSVVQCAPRVVLVVLGMVLRWSMLGKASVNDSGLLMKTNEA